MAISNPVASDDYTSPFAKGGLRGIKSPLPPFYKWGELVSLVLAGKVDTRKGHYVELRNEAANPTYQTIC